MMPRYEESLTGRLRAKPKLFGRHTLQVEVREDALQIKYDPPPHYNAEQVKAYQSRPPEVVHSRTFWRDATWEDLAGRNIVFDKVLA